MNDPRKQRLLEWLLTPKAEREPSTQTELAKEIGVESATLNKWKRDKEFVDEWDTNYKATVGSPAKKQEILAALFRTATDEEDPRQVPAARAYLEAVDAIKPPKMDVTVQHKAAASLSDEELLAAVAERAKVELDRRGVSAILDADVSKVVDYAESADKES